MGVTTDTITNWELGHTEPEVRYLPPIIGFLGYVPFVMGESFAEWIKAFRHMLGFSQRRFAKEVGIDPSTLLKWENLISTPSKRLLMRVESLMRNGHQL